MRTAMTMRPYDKLLARLSRRDLLKAAWWLGVSAIVQPIVSTRLLAKPVFRDYPFPLGVASGDPLPDGVVLWTRLAPDPLNGGGMPNAAVEVEWEVADDRQFGNVLKKGTAIARPELGHAVHVEVNGLDAASEYFYRFRAGDEVSQVGRTKTAPAAGAAVNRLRFAVCGCNHYEEGFFTAFRRIAEEEFDFVLHTGDYIYEYRRDGGRRPDVPRQHATIEPYTVTDYRNRYAQYKMDSNLIAVHRSAPFVMMADDHEVENNYAGQFDASDTPPEIFLLRRAAAYQAYYETMPLRAAALPHGNEMRLYRRLQFGSLLDLSVLDTRQWRSDQACGDGIKPLCPEALAPMRTMMGAEQERWLVDNLAAARARWTVIGEQVHTFARDMTKATPSGFYMDVWDGYPAARNRLYSRIRETKAPNPIVFSGDIHSHYAADLKMDFTKPQSETIAVEFTNSSISSGGDGTDLPAQWDKYGRDNPHIKYASNRRGYIAITATPQRMEAQYKILDKVTVPDQPIRLGATVVVEAGRPGIVGASGS